LHKSFILAVGLQRKVHSTNASNYPSKKAPTFANCLVQEINPGFAFQELSLINMHQASILICRALSYDILLNSC
jgi:hypothetical protein